MGCVRGKPPANFINNIDWLNKHGGNFLKRTGSKSIQNLTWDFYVKQHHHKSPNSWRVRLLYSSLTGVSLCNREPLEFHFMLSTWESPLNRVERSPGTNESAAAFCKNPRTPDFKHRSPFLEVLGTSRNRTTPQDGTEEPISPRQFRHTAPQPTRQGTRYPDVFDATEIKLP